MTKDDYPGAPPHAYVCEEGWLVINDEAWTREEWASPVQHRGKWGRPGRPPKHYATERERRRAESWRRYARRRYAERKAAAA